MPHHAVLRTSFSKLSGFVNLAKNIIFIRHWKTLMLYINAKLERGSDYLSSRRERRGKRNTVESAVSLATTEESNFQVPDSDTRAN